MSRQVAPFIISLNFTAGFVSRQPTDNIIFLKGLQSAT